MATEKYTARTQFVPRRARSRKYREAGITEARARQLIGGGTAEVSKRWDINNLKAMTSVRADLAAKDAQLSELTVTAADLQAKQNSSDAKLQELADTSKKFSETLTVLSYTVATAADIEKMCETAFS